MRRWLKYWRILAASLVVAIILGVALWPEAVAVDVAHAERGPLLVTIDEEGETRVRERFVVSAPVAGRIQRIALEPGDRVIRGKTVLVHIAPAPATLLDPRAQAELRAGLEVSRANVRLAHTERERAATALTRAQTSFRRQQELADAGAISRDELEAAQTSLQIAQEALRGSEITVSRAEYDVQLARARLQQPASSGRPIDVVSPIDGLVFKRLRESEAVVAAGEPLIELGDFSQLEIVADLLSTDAVRVPVHARVLVEQWGGAGTLEGRVRRVEPSGFMKVSALGVEEQRVNIHIDLVDASATGQRLGDGYRVEVRIVVWEQPDVLKVPMGGLFRRGADWAVFALEGNRLRARIVDIGQRNGTEAQIVDGLEAGQAIVLHPPDSLADGTRIVPR